MLLPLVLADSDITAFVTVTFTVLENFSSVSVEESYSSPDIVIVAVPVDFADIVIVLELFSTHKFFSFVIAVPELDELISSLPVCVGAFIVIVDVFPASMLIFDFDTEKLAACATGNGPVDAAIRAIKQIIHRTMVVKEFLIQAINKGSNDVGKVHMTVEHDGNSYYGFSANTDIVAASAEAFIDAINKFVR